MLARSIGVKRYVFGVISGVAGAYQLNLVFRDRQEGDIRKVTRMFEGGADSLIPEIRHAAFELVYPQGILGELWIECPTAGFIVLVDDVVKGKTPIQGPVGRLSPGRKKIEFRYHAKRSKKRKAIVRWVDIIPFETKVVRISQMEAEPGAP